jgi:hypothetical protein
LAWSKQVREKPGSEASEISEERPNLRESFRREVVKARQVLRERGLSEPEIDAEMNLAERKKDD